jgi:hypothetical protein
LRFLSIIENSHTFGFTFPDSLANAYFYAITPSRKVAAKAAFKIENPAFKKNKLALLKGLSIADATKQNFYVVLYSEELVADKVQSVIYKVTASGLAWQNSVALEGTPLETTIGSAGELVIKISTASGNKLVTAQPDGKKIN